jgi:beta,beta-carotene 9',10'-dioxygenase
MVDLKTGASTSFSDGAHISVNHSSSRDRQDGGEDDGVLLAVGAAQDAESSVLAVIDARTMALVASAEVPSSIPLGFHGSFLRA